MDLVVQHNERQKVTHVTNESEDVHGVLMYLPALERASMLAHGVVRSRC